MKRYDEGGFALAAVILTLVISGVLITGGLFVARQESRIGSASKHGVEAFYTAERGIADVMESWSVAAMAAQPLWQDTTVTGTTEQGSWAVTVRRVGDQLYLLDSQGRAPLGAVQANNELADQHVASRRIGVLARLVSLSLDAPAALVTHEDVDFRGAPPRIVGFDTPAWPAPFCSASLEHKPGLITDDDDDMPEGCQEDAGEDEDDDGLIGGLLGDGSGCSWIQGEPHVVEDEAEVDEVFESYDEMWEELVSMATITMDGGQVRPAVSLSNGTCNTSDPLNWGDPLNPWGPCGRYFPLIHVTGDVRFTGNGAGQGILLVEGDATWVGNFDFYGIIMVRGHTEMRGSPVIRGALISDDTDNWRGTPDLLYSSCAVGRSILENDALTSLRPLGTRGWVDLSALQD